MILIAGEKGCGKTTRLVQISAKTGDYIVTRDRWQAHYIATIAKRANLTIPYPLTYDEFLSHRWCGRGISGFLIDDVDVLLENMLGFEKPINVITATIDEVQEDDERPWC